MNLNLSDSEDALNRSSQPVSDDKPAPESIYILLEEIEQHPDICRNCFRIRKRLDDNKEWFGDYGLNQDRYDYFCSCGCGTGKSVRSSSGMIDGTVSREWGSDGQHLPLRGGSVSVMSIVSSLIELFEQSEYDFDLDTSAMYSEAERLKQDELRNRDRDVLAGSLYEGLKNSLPLFDFEDVSDVRVSV